MPGAASPAILAEARRLQATNPALLAKPSNAAFRQALDATENVPVALIDRAKQVLDRTIHRRPTNTDELKRLAATKTHLNNLLAEADAQVPDYGKARAVAATYKQLGTAVKSAQKARVEKTLKGNIGFRLRPFDIRSPRYAAAHGVVSALSGLAPQVSEQLGPDFIRMLLTGAGGRLGGQPLGGPHELLQLLSQLRSLPPQGASLLPAAAGGYAAGHLAGQ